MSLLPDEHSIIKLSLSWLKDAWGWFLAWLGGGGFATWIVQELWKKHKAKKKTIKFHHDRLEKANEKGELFKMLSHELANGETHYQEIKGLLLQCERERREDREKCEKENRKTLDELNFFKEKYKVLAEDYAFIKNLFSHDGVASVMEAARKAKGT